MTVMKRFADYLWIAPVFMVISVLMVYPLVNTTLLSFQQKLPGGSPTFVGFSNYIDILSSGLFWSVLSRTLVFTLASILLKLALGTGAALILNNSFLGRDLLRSWLFVPWTVPLFAGGILFSWIFRMNGGLNLIIRNLGGQPVFWLGPQFAMFSVVVLNVWKGFPFFMVGLLAGLQIISRDLYEASAIDGAGDLQQFFSVTLPGLRDVVLILTVLSSIWTFAQFESIFVITGGGPGTSTETFSLSVYKTAFERYDFPLAAAIAVCALPVFLLLIRWLIRTVHEEGQL